MQIIKHKRTLIVGVSIAIVLFTAGVVIFWKLNYSNDGPPIGSRYKIVQPMYLMAIYDDLNNKKISRETARAFLHATKYYEKSSVAFQRPVPAGTVLTIVAPEPKVWHLPFFANRYLVKLTPDLSDGLDVVLELDRGIEGELDGLNSRLFAK